jgi:RNA polymerase sigma-70 factor, ECF subfamily
MSMGGERDVEVADFLLGDPPAVAVVSEAVEHAVRSFRFTDPVLNQELVQETVSRVFVNLTSGRFRGESSLRTYACRVARYTCLEHLRRRRFEVELHPENLPCHERWSEPEQSFLWTEEHLKNLEIFSGLPLACRDLLKMIFLEKLSYREVGLKLGLSESAIKTRVYRCRAAFRRSAGLQRLTSERRLDRKVKT